MAEVETHGTGQVERTADRAVLAVSFAEHAKDRAGAVTALTARIETVESALNRDGVEVRERRLSVHDAWDGKRRSGARATQSYTVRVTDLAALNDLIVALVLAQPANLAGPSWELVEHDDAMRQAQREAVADARRRAETYVEALGCRLGQPLRVSDGPGSPQPAGFTTMSAVYRTKSATQPDITALSLEPQLVTVAASCTAAWTIDHG